MLCAGLTLVVGFPAGALDLEPFNRNGVTSALDHGYVVYAFPPKTNLDSCAFFIELVGAQDGACYTKHPN